MKESRYIEKIMESEGLTNQEVQNLIKEKKKELKDLISTEGALFIIFRELGLEFKENKSKSAVATKDDQRKYEKNNNSLENLQISALTLDMKNINLVGRVLQIYQIHNFDKEDGSVGTVGSFLLKDTTGEIKITLWDEKANIFESPKFEVNKPIRILNGYSKSDRNGRIEVHLGRLGKVQLNPNKIEHSLLPKIKDDYISVAEINLSLLSASIKGKVVQITPINTFTKKNGVIGKISTITILDKTGTINIIFWNDDVNKVQNIRVDDSLSVKNLIPRQNYRNSDKIDLIVNNNTIIKKLETPLNIEAKTVENINMIQDLENIISLKGIITSVDNLREISLKNGENIYLLGFSVSDDTDAVRVALWREEAEDYSEILKTGLGVLLSNVLIKYSDYSNRKEISLIKGSKLEVIEIEIKNLKNLPTKDSIETHRINENVAQNKYAQIGEINKAKNVMIKVCIVKDIGRIHIYEACTNCKRKIDNCNCKVDRDFKFKTITNLTVEDETGTIRAVFIGEIADKILKKDSEYLVKIKETEEFESFLKDKSKELLGKDIIIQGRTKFSDYSNSYEVIVNDFDYLDVGKELDAIMERIKI